MMLVLGRHPGEAIRIGEDIFVHVVSVRGQVVRIGIDAPPEVEVVRTEIIGRDKGKEV